MRPVLWPGGLAGVMCRLVQSLQVAAWRLAVCTVNASAKGALQMAEASERSCGLSTVTHWFGFMHKHICSCVARCVGGLCPGCVLSDWFGGERDV